MVDRMIQDGETQFVDLEHQPPRGCFAQSPGRSSNAYADATQSARLLQHGVRQEGCWLHQMGFSVQVGDLERAVLVDILLVDIL